MYRWYSKSYKLDESKISLDADAKSKFSNDVIWDIPTLRNS